MTRKLTLLLLLAQMFLYSTAGAQTCQYEWCSAPWPPAAGADRTVGKDNCGNTCIKIAKTSTTSYRVFMGKENDLFHTDIRADTCEIITTSPNLVCKYQGKEVARFDKNLVWGWMQN